MSKQVETLWFIEYYHPGTDEWVTFNTNHIDVSLFFKSESDATVALDEVRKWFKEYGQERQLRVAQFDRSKS